MRPLQYGVTEYDPARAYPGFTLFSPSGGTDSFLIDMRGEIRKKWALPGTVGNYGQLLLNGNLLVTLRSPEGPNFNPAGGRILEFDWDGNIVWEHIDHFQHHDFNRLPNGNTLYLAWELIPTADAKMIGGIPGTEHEDGGVYYDQLREVNPAGDIVWEWRMADHFPFENYPLRANRPREEFAHANACFVQPDGNIILSWRDLDLIALLDRETGKFIWELQDRKWGGQHDPRLLDNGHITLFANGSEQVGPEFSRVLEIDPARGDIVWTYSGTPLDTFYSSRISGAQRLVNGNTFICEGRHGRLFEVTSDGDIVWEFISPHQNVRSDGITRQIFRSLRYGADSSEIGGRLKQTV